MRFRIPFLGNEKGSENVFLSLPLPASPPLVVSSSKRTPVRIALTGVVFLKR